ncbi:MAG: methyl-accepting chemotaxis protein [Ferrovum sp. 37-45-19]|nr:MAG: methyl-accepting chemotaxis protein [Ferrovum sp. 21-44-67]OYV93269.1 MAG: methyl-accepting chemotaxis protein [Ferrovum sp. 37-45-19]OZB31966.1 MAG: methyl-accepting chemotaxis protein [Ferrovum sp. 34-44-207]
MSEGATTQQAALIAYPKQAAFGRVLPKNKIYEHSGANTRLKDLFVAQVEQIIWQYKLAPETINLPARSGVSEIQIFSIQLKSTELHEDVLRCIDGAVQFPIIFELNRGQGDQAQTQVVAAYKRPGEADASRWVLSSYFATDWMSAATARTAMPLALDMAQLYSALLQRLIPLLARSQESLADWVARVDLVTAKRREVEKTQARLAKEKQFNRKVEINATLRQLMNELQRLTI